MHCILYTHTRVLFREIRMRGVLAAVRLSVTLQLCISITAVAIMLQGATTIYWTAAVLQERRGGKKEYDNIL